MTSEGGPEVAGAQGVSSKPKCGPVCSLKLIPQVSIDLGPASEVPWDPGVQFKGGATECGWNKMKASHWGVSGLIFLRKIFMNLDKFFEFYISFFLLK